MSKTSEVANIANSIILATSVIAGIVGVFVFYDDIRGALATKDFHHQDMEQRQQEILEAFEAQLAPIAKSAREGESNTLPPRISNLLRLRCVSPSEFEQGMPLHELLSGLRERYAELNGREYRTGECREGVYYNALGQRMD